MFSDFINYSTLNSNVSTLIGLAHRSDQCTIQLRNQQNIHALPVTTTTEVGGVRSSVMLHRRFANATQISIVVQMKAVEVGGQ